MDTLFLIGGIYSCSIFDKLAGQIYPSFESVNLKDHRNMLLLSFLLFSTLLSVIAAPLDGSGVKTKISRRGPTTGGSTVGKQPGQRSSTEGPVLVELLRQYAPTQSYLTPNAFKKSGTQAHSHSQSDSVKQPHSQSHSNSQPDSVASSDSQPNSVKEWVAPSRLVAPPVEDDLLPVIHLDLPPMWQERWSLLFSMPNGWCRAISAAKGTRSMERCPTNPQGRKTIASLPKFPDLQARQVFIMDLISDIPVPTSVGDVASSVNAVIGGDVEYLNNIMKGPVKERIGKVPETWIESYESMHEVMIHGNGEWHGPTTDGKWEYYDPVRSLWFTYDYAPQQVEEDWNEVQKSEDALAA
ncbi:hypothetical protein DFJ43DRAFT_1106148 [Lentinula guzmanii]|uniref:Uncharacterized protein n=1 Tax=Lentinula guzmanii TaxID=2804957 RepID=A0AA38MQM4_9AGAR|nr:hypothetical protein DFJ43DRAFT_1106148 [Lentinula guzmanii]